MKALIAGKFSPVGVHPIGGVQSWSLTVGSVLRRLGYQVAFWEHGQAEPAGRFDVGILANWGRSGRLAGLCDRWVNVSHGIIDEEQPVGAGPVAFTSEGVRNHWKGMGPIIRQPIDLDFWVPRETPRATLTRFSYRAGLPMVPPLALLLGLRYEHVSSLPPVAVRQRLQASACVLATGRASLEAMACGVPVVICDHRSAYQGALLDPDTLGSVARNYSGRGGIVPTSENVRAAVLSAMDAGSLRAHVEQNHDARMIVASLLEIER